MRSRPPGDITRGNKNTTIDRSAQPTRKALGRGLLLVMLGRHVVCEHGVVGHGHERLAADLEGRGRKYVV